MSETRPTNEPARHFLKNWWKILISGFVLMFCFSNILSFVKNSTRAYLSSVVLSFDFRRTFIIHFSRRENTFSFPVHKLCSGFSFLFFAFILFSNQCRSYVYVVSRTSHRIELCQQISWNWNNVYAHLLVHQPAITYFYLLSRYSFFFFFTCSSIAMTWTAKKEKNFSHTEFCSLTCCASQR